jgi:hypothetical protein
VGASSRPLWSMVTGTFLDMPVRRQHRIWWFPPVFGRVPAVSARREALDDLDGAEDDERDGGADLDRSLRQSLTQVGARHDREGVGGDHAEGAVDPCAEPPVNGQDPFATGEEQVGFACRVYAGPDGLSGSPTVEQFMAVLA